MPLIRRAAPLLLLLLLAGMPLPAWAQSCAAALNPVAFGVYNRRLANDTTTTSSLTITCSGILPIGVTLLVNYTVKFGPGLSGNQLARRMYSGTKSLLYQLRYGSQNGALWGDGTGGTTFASGSWLLGIFTPPQVYTVYGRIPTGQNVGAGSYADTVLVTVSY